MKGLLAILTKGKSPMGGSKGMPMDDESMEPKGTDEASESSEDEYGGMLADMLGVAKEDRGAFNDALSGFVRQCMQKE